jgi:hypothetical protein
VVIHLAAVEAVQVQLARQVVPIAQVLAVLEVHRALQVQVLHVHQVDQAVD